MKKIVSLLLGFLFIFFSVNAQKITGDWSGELKVMGQSLSIVLHIKKSGQHLTGTMDSPDQYAHGIPIDKITFMNPKINIQVANGAIVYDGRLKSPDTLVGSFKQNGFTLPLPLHKGAIKEKKPVRPQRPKPPFPYRSDTVTFKNKKAGIQFSGILTRPKKGQKFPAVILIWGSGPNDRNETILGHKPFWVIADYLSRQGLAVLRFDKRGVGQSGGIYKTATTKDFASDVEAAVLYLQARKDIIHTKIGLIGHSEGGIIAPMVAAKDTSLALIVLLAGPGVDGADLLVMQNRAIGKAQGMTPEQLAQAAQENRDIYNMVLNNDNDSILEQKLTKVMMAEMSNTIADSLKRKIVSRKVRQIMSPWIRYFLKLNPADYLKKVRCPVLALDGTKDLQVPPKQNITAIKKALEEGGNEQVTPKILPNLNHLFQKAKTGLPSEYGNIEQTFSPKALNFMGKWILKQVR